MGAVREHISADRPERVRRDPPAAQPAHSAGPAIAAPGAMLDGIGNRALLALLRSGRLRRRARISEPGDTAEHEADRVARQVTSMPDRTPAVPAPAPRQLPAPSSDLGDGVPTAVREVLGSPGQRLDPPVRDFFEARLGYDLSEVRLHTDTPAAESARSLAADAYTTGAHIAFAAGRHRPETPQGRELLAHELAHVVQQKDNAAVIQRAPAPANLQSDAPPAAAPAPPVGNPTSRVSDDDWMGTLEIMRRQSPGEFVAILVATERIFYPLLARYGFRGSHSNDDDYLADFDRAVKKWGKARIYLQKAGPPPKPPPKSREERQYEDAQMLVIQMNQHGFLRADVNDALEDFGLMDDLERHGFEKADAYSTTTSETYEQRAIKALIDFIGRYRVAHNITLRPTASVPSPDLAAYYRVWSQGLEYVTSSVVAAEFAEFARNFTDDPEKITGAAGFGAAFEGAAGSFGIAVGNRGSYAPDVEDKPISVQVQELRYTGPQPIEPLIDPARVAEPPPREPLPQPDPVTQAPAIIESDGAGGRLASAPRITPEIAAAEQMGFITPGTHQGASASAGTSRSLTTGIRADQGEIAAYQARLARGEIGLERPQGSNVTGPDYVTASRDPDGTIWINVGDTKSRVSATSRFGRTKTSLPQTWSDAVVDAVSPARLRLADPALEQEIRDALQSGRVRIRQDNVDFSPSGGGSVTLDAR